jgi:long-subunit acyl-CoA synthetase (AMP-forming)
MIIETTTQPSNVATEPRSLCEVFQQTAARHSDRPALRTHGSSDVITWGEYAERVRRMAAGLAVLGIGRGDTVALMLTNRPEAMIVDAAALHLGATPFSIYNTSSPEQIEFLLDHAQSRVAVTEIAFVDRIGAARAQLPMLEHVLVVDGETDDARRFAEPGEGGEDGFDFESAWRAVTPDDVAVLIYTSGTTGPPKGVELTHANVIAEWSAVSKVLPIRDEGELISYLPMAHLADRVAAYYLAMFTGATITCIPDARQMVGALPEVRPSLVLAVPRIWERLKAALEAGFAAEPDQHKRAAVLGAVDAGMRKVRLEMDGQPVPTHLAEACQRADVAIFSTLRERLGLDQADCLLSGAAPIAGEVLEFFAALGLRVCEAWGMSESTALGTVNPPEALRIGTVGKPSPDHDVQLADDGELLIRGPGVMRGYRNDPDKTAEVLDADGWLHTGDIGELDADGYVRIVDRKKELIINTAGKNMSPANIENHLKSACGLIGVAVAVGDARPFNTALIVLDPEVAAAFAKRHGITDVSPAALAKDECIGAEIAAGVARANERLSRVEQIKRFTILPMDWQPGGDELTPTMKLKRKPIAERYASEIESMYT